MTIALITLVAMLAAAINAVAGGGTFLAFPALTGLGRITEISANIACTIGLWPGSAASVIPARSDLKTVPRRIAIAYCIVCLCGGTIGSLLLLHTSASAFSRAIPWLLLFATTVFAMGKRISHWAGRASYDAVLPSGARPDGVSPDAVSHNVTSAHSPGWTIFVGFVQFIVAIYGGYFGAGIGVLTLAGLSFAGIGDLKKVNALKVLLSTCTNLSAAIIFLFGPVPWRFAGPMAAASTIGGFAGMALARRLPQSILRNIILTIAIALTAAYFYKTFA